MNRRVSDLTPTPTLPPPQAIASETSPCKNSDNNTIVLSKYSAWYTWLLQRRKCGKVMCQSYTNKNLYKQSKGALCNPCQTWMTITWQRRSSYLFILRLCFGFAARKLCSPSFRTSAKCSDEFSLYWPSPAPNSRRKTSWQLATSLLRGQWARSELRRERILELPSSGGQKYD